MERDPIRNDLSVPWVSALEQNPERGSRILNNMTIRYNGGGTC